MYDISLEILACMYTAFDICKVQLIIRARKEKKRTIQKGGFSMLERSNISGLIIKQKRLILQLSIADPFQKCVIQKLSHYTIRPKIMNA